MSSEFAEVIDRTGTNSLKWDRREEVFGREDVLPMWVADSDWKTAQPVIDALVDRAKHGIFGYTKPGEKIDKLVVDWIRERHGWAIDPEWIVYTNGVVPSISVALRTYTHRGDGVVIQPPVYYPFFETINRSGAGVVNNELVLSDKGYEMNFGELDSKCVHNHDMLPKKPDPRVLLLCNPHNPVGRVWDKEELARVAEICLENDLLVISDDIHAEFTYPGNEYTPIASLDDKILHNTITLFSPSKAFNTAGVPAAVAIIPNPSLREDFVEGKTKLLNGPSIFGVEILKAAYSLGDQWLSRQLDYLNDNVEFAVNTINEEFTGVSAMEPEGTTLVWIDFRDLHLSEDELEDFLVNRARVGLDMGKWFGPGGEGFARLNVACSRDTLEEGLERISQALVGFNGPN